MKINWLNSFFKKQNVESVLLKQENAKLQETNSILIKQIQELNNELKYIKLKSNLPKETQDLINFYDNKYINKNIIYKGTIIKTKHLGDLKPEILVCDYIHITENIKRWIKDNKLEFNQVPSKENISQHSWKIYSEFIKNKKYILDNQLFGIEEMWLSNFEQMYVKRDKYWLGDCENLANLCLALILASGIPRGLARVTTGTSNIGGHASLTCWDWRTGKFEQWETTSNTPLLVKEDNPIYIHTVWFSFDNELSWTKLDKTEYNSIKK